VKNLTGRHVQNGQLQYRQKKTGVFEYLPLSPTAIQLLGDIQQTDEPIFKLPKSEGGLWTHLQIWVTKAGITKHVSFHVARHTFATLALTYSKDLFLVSKLLGHKDIKHTQIYAKIIDDRKQEAVSSLPSIIL
jgi:integrase